MEDLYKAYFQAMPCYVSIQDRDLRIVEANERFVRDFGDYRGRHCFEVYKHRDERCEICPVTQTFEDGECHKSEEFVRTGDGREVAVLVRSTPIRDGEGTVVAVMEVSTDITEIHTLQNQLKESEERYHLLFDQVPCYISVQDPELNIVEANGRFQKAFGMTTPASKCYEVYKHRREECLHCPVQRTFKDGQVHHSEEVVVSLSGEQIHTLVYTAPIYDAQGGIKSVMEMSTNITPIRELQSQLESVGLLISSISHGIKGLLNGLDGGMYLVNTGLKKDKPDRVKKGWEMVERNVDRIRGQVMNILYYAKEREPNWETLSAVTLGRDVLKILHSKTAELNIDLRDDVQNSAGEFEADPQALRSLLINLLENSIDACRVDNKQGTHYVSLGVEGGEDDVRFIVQDNGIGMDQETRDKASSLFFSSKGAKGTGLGLFIANKIAKAHGGRIHLESELDKGSRFVVALPRQRPEVQPG